MVCCLHGILICGGIVNGIDYQVYDPAADTKIYTNYKPSDFRKKNT